MSHPSSAKDLVIGEKQAEFLIMSCRKISRRERGCYSRKMLEVWIGVSTAAALLLEV
jgi:hypothetical protein